LRELTGDDLAAIGGADVASSSCEDNRPIVRVGAHGALDPGARVVTGTNRRSALRVDARVLAGVDDPACGVNYRLPADDEQAVPDDDRNPPGDDHGIKLGLSRNGL
jgi:hypothetical protein